MSIYQSGKIKEIVKGYTNTYATASSSAKTNKVWVENHVSENGQVGMRIHIDMSTYNLKSKQCHAAAYFYTESGIALDDTNNSYYTGNGKVSCGKTFTPQNDYTLYEDFTMFMPYSELHISEDGDYMFFISIWDTSVSPSKELCQSNWSKFTYKSR